MNDTSEEVRAEYRERLLATDTSRRLRMMAGMFSAARAIAIAGAGGSANPCALFRRMYRTDFSASQLDAIAEHLGVHAKE